MQLHLTEDQNGVLLPQAALDLLPDADENDLRVLLFAASRAREGKPFDENDVAEALSIARSEATASIKLWRGAGVFTTGKARAKKPAENTEKRVPLPQKRKGHLSAAELADIAEGNEVFRNLLDMAQETAGWIFNTAEIEIIADLYSNLRLAPEYILALLGYYVRKREKPLRYAETVAYSFIDQGIDTPEQLEERLRLAELFESREGKIRKMFGIGGRKLSAREEGYLRDWFDRFGFDDDVIALAYEKTVNSTGKASLSYANSILSAWYGEGVKTASDAKALSADKRGKKPQPSQKKTTAQSFDVDAFFNKALARSYGETEKKEP